MAKRTLRPISLSFVFLAISWPATSSAEGFDANQYQPTPIATDGLSVSRPTAQEHGSFGVVGTLSYAHKPLLERGLNQDGVEESRSLIEHQVYGFFGLSYGLWDRLTLHGTIPVSLMQSGSEPLGADISQPSSTALGDLRLGARYRILGGLEGDNPSRFGLAFDASVFLPTGSRDGFASDGKVRVNPSLIAEALPITSVYLGANVGVMARPSAEVAGASVGSDFHLAGSAGYRTERDRIRVGIEATSKTRLNSDAFQGGASAVETLGVAAMRFLDGSLIASLGAGPGFSSAPGAPDFRAVARVGWAPTASRGYEAAPLADRDGDGIPDSEDACPDIAGVTHEDPDKHGCPSDRDGDGIPDSEDACPDVAGVTHDDPDKHGCPSDRDGDGIPDAEDACPDVAGVAHDDPDKHGCPSDRDGDGIPDAEDACPDVAGVASDDTELHGCPPAVVTEKAIEITEQIHFEFGLAALRPDSDTMLRSIARALRDNPNIEKLSIEGHTDERGTDDFNMNLSRLRAEAVRAWLIANGVDASRLTTRGYGKTRPIADNATEEGREKNRRVEFRIIERAK